MKKIILSALCIFGYIGLAQPTFATQCGPYIGLGHGLGKLRVPDKNVFEAGTGPALTYNRHDQGGLAGRAFIGYNITSGFGIEGGYSRYPRSRYIATQNNGTSNMRYYARAYDVVGKLYYPLGTPVANIYVLAGVASYTEQIKFANTGIPVIGNFASPQNGTTNIRVNRPLYGLGFSWDPIHHLSTRLEATRIQKLGNFESNSRAIPYADLVTLNIAYYFR